jgi:hypothetical protein
VSALTNALEAAGIEFIDENGGGPGVRSPPFAKIIEHDVLGGAEMGRQAWHGRRKMGPPSLMKKDAILAAWHRADGLSFNRCILPAALPLQPKRDRP